MHAQVDTPHLYLFARAVRHTSVALCRVYAARGRMSFCGRGSVSRRVLRQPARLADEPAAQTPPVPLGARLRLIAARSRPASYMVEADVCIVGPGPAGTTLALAL